MSSNSNGRAFEFIVTKTLIDEHQCFLSEPCKYMQNRDELLYKSLPTIKQEHLKRASFTLSKYLNQIYSISKSEVIRLTDNLAKSKDSDVTDIRLITTKNDCINISLKNNHSAIKHNRPGALANQCGFPVKSNEDLVYRGNYNTITKKFQDLVNLSFGKTELFKDIKSKDSNFINKNLYQPICQNVVDFINNNVKNDAFHSVYLFKFLIGSQDFIKVVLRDNLEITNYYELPMPTNLFAELKDNSYVIITFDNSYKISMRLHTASSKINGVSLKFDSQLISSNLKPIFLNI